jgi:hypothetical protein
MKKGLIIKRCWLDQIFDHGKVWEMRTSRTKYTGKIHLIESGTGTVVGEAELIGCSERPVPKHKDLIKYHRVENLDLLDRWRWAWFLSNPIRYKEPIPYRHPKGAVIWVNL